MPADPVPDGDPLIQIILLLVLILVNAFFAASEIAVITLNDNKIQKMAEEGHKKAQKILKLTKNSSRFLSTIQIGVPVGLFDFRVCVSELCEKAGRRYDLSPLLTLCGGRRGHGDYHHYPFLFLPGSGRAGAEKNRYAEVRGPGVPVYRRAERYRHDLQALCLFPNRVHKLCAPAAAD